MKLTHAEALYLYDTLYLPEGGSRDLLLKVGGAIMLTKDRGDTNVEFTLSELWSIREQAKSSVVVGQEKVGLNLIYKLAPLLGKLMRGYDIEELRDKLKEEPNAGNTDPDTSNTGYEAPREPC